MRFTIELFLLFNVFTCTPATFLNITLSSANPLYTARYWRQDIFVYREKSQRRKNAPQFHFRYPLACPSWNQLLRYSSPDTWRNIDFLTLHLLAIPKGSLAPRFNKYRNYPEILKWNMLEKATQTLLFYTTSFSWRNPITPLKQRTRLCFAVEWQYSSDIDKLYLALKFTDDKSRYFTPVKAFRPLINVSRPHPIYQWVRSWKITAIRIK